MKNNVLFKIFLGVLTAHVGFFLAYVLWGNNCAVKKKLVVNQVAIEKPKFSPKIEPVKPKKTSPKPAPKKTVPTPNPIPKEAANILQKLNQEITKKEHKVESKPLLAPSTITSLQIDNKVDDYEKQLVAQLQQSLELPEQGEITIRLIIKPDGNLVNLQVLKAASDKNLLYIKNTLPAVVFPCFNGKERTFTICFQNQK